MDRISFLIQYLKDLEGKPDFQPWDNDEHAIQNLITVHQASESDARKAVSKFRVFVKCPG